MPFESEESQAGEIPARRQVEHRLGEKLIPWKGPAKVDFHVGTKWPVSRQREGEIARFLPAPLVHQAHSVPVRAVCDSGKLLPEPHAR